MHQSIKSALIPNVIRYGIVTILAVAMLWFVPVRAAQEGEGRGGGGGQARPRPRKCRPRACPMGSRT